MTTAGDANTRHATVEECIAITARAEPLVDQLMDMDPDDAAKTLVAINTMMLLLLQSKSGASPVEVWDNYFVPAVHQSLAANMEAGVDRRLRETLR